MSSHQRLPIPRSYHASGPPWKRMLALFLSVVVFSMPASALPSTKFATQQVGGEEQALSTPPRLLQVKVAFVGDHGVDPRTTGRVFRMIKDEGCEALLSLGDLDYQDNPKRFVDFVDEHLGPTFPILPAIGNHDVGRFHGTGGYHDVLVERMKRTPQLECTGEFGVNLSCRFRRNRAPGTDLHLVVSGVGSFKDDHTGFIRDMFSEAVEGTWGEDDDDDEGSTMKGNKKKAKVGQDDGDGDDGGSTSGTPWRICMWHKNQRMFQIGKKEDETGYGTYEQCREAGAIVATAHEHTYSRTYAMSSFATQTVDPTQPRDKSSLTIRPGTSFAFVSGLGGDSVRKWNPMMRFKPWWAAVAAKDNSARAGALMCTFNYGGDATKAHCYMKDISGRVYDDFIVTRDYNPKS
ncbi:hypothetical protein BJ742DRAFT_194312 [Cladochytrium replicatum]|nr:hypothetical protein BJ742DRAFT_194312 [Cladochytrium replicatum]